MKLHNNNSNVVAIVIEILCFHAKMNGLAFQVVITLTNESMHALIYNVKKINFINRIKYAEVKIFSICVDIYKTYEGVDFDKIYEILSRLKNKKLKINNTLIDLYKDMLLNLNFGQNKISRIAEGICKIGHDSIRLLKWICYYYHS